MEIDTYQNEAQQLNRIFTTDDAVSLNMTEFPKDECLPNRFKVEIIDCEKDSRCHVKTLIDGKPFGQELTDNAYIPDGFRFHDVIHFAFASVLGWSPVTRKFLGRKRKSQPLIDEVEDGGRAIAIEEGVVALVFAYARRHRFLEDISTIDYQLLDSIKDMTAHLEVKRCTANEWEQAILQGFDVWRSVNAARGGCIDVNLAERRIDYLCPTAD